MRPFHELSSATWMTIDLLVPIWNAALRAADEGDSPSQRAETLRHLALARALATSAYRNRRLLEEELFLADWQSVIDALRLIDSANASGDDRSVLESTVG
jgi:hypothetical protein